MSRSVAFLAAVLLLGCEPPAKEAPPPPEPPPSVAEAPKPPEPEPPPPPEPKKYSVVYCGGSGGAPDIIMVSPQGVAKRLTSFMGYDGQPAISPDGRTLAFVSRRSGKLKVHILDLTKGTVRKLLDDPRPETVSVPAWSPDGKSLAIMVSFAQNRDIFTIDLDGSNLERITTDRGLDTQPAWSPDGTEIAFVSNRGGALAVYVKELESGNLRPLGVEGATFSPNWSLDGERLYFTASVDGLGLYSTKRDGTDLQKLDVEGERNTTPCWSPDGSQLIFFSIGKGKKAVYRFDPSTAKSTLVADNAAEQWTTWGPGDWESIQGE